MSASSAPVIILDDDISATTTASNRATNGYLSVFYPHWIAPRCTVYCEKPARPRLNDIPAHEYLDTPLVLQEKIHLLAQLLLHNQQIFAYTGAGLSTSAGIRDYASESAGKLSQIEQYIKREDLDPLDARPTASHQFLNRLYEGGVLHWWCQQNHDGLPQKAGLPAYAINELHGGWFDPSNRVKRMDEDLREDLHSEMIHWNKKGKLCLALGTSLAGLSADMLVNDCGLRAQQRFNQFTKCKKRKADTALEGNPQESRVPKQILEMGGSVIAGFQETSMDDIAALRIYAPVDEVFRLLREALIALLVEQQRNGEVSLYPQLLPVLQPAMQADDPLLWMKRLRDYEAQGKYLAGSRVLEDHRYQLAGYNPQTGAKFISENFTGRSTKNSMSRKDNISFVMSPVVLDLRVGKNVRITVGDDINIVGRVLEILPTGDYNIRWHAKRHFRYKDGTKGFDERISHRRLGLWMIVGALEGKLSVLPIVNV